MDNARHAQNKPGQYQKDCVYQDDKCWYHDEWLRRVVYYSYSY
jgi:hypothetical protein